MNNNLALDDTGDLYEKNGQIQQVTSLDEAAQAIACDMRTFLGEYWLDKGLGVPYYTVVFVKSIDLSIIKTLLKNHILKNKYVTEVTKFVFVTDTANRSATVTFSALTTYGEITDQEIDI